MKSVYRVKYYKKNGEIVWTPYLAECSEDAYEQAEKDGIELEDIISARKERS
jgi:hypothetical protein